MTRVKGMIPVAKIIQESQKLNRYSYSVSAWVLSNG